MENDIKLKKKFWNNKLVAISGSNGFLGKKLIKKLKSLDIPINIVEISSKQYDLRRQSDIRNFFKKFKPSYIFHLAANVGGIGANMKNPATFFYDNSIMGINFMHESYLNNVKKFLATATVCAYPEKTKVPFEEKDLWMGYPEPTNAPYGIAKKILSVQSKAYREQYNFNSIVLYPVNLYGPGDNFDLNSSHVIPALIKKIFSAKKNNIKYIEAWGTGKARREFLYVDDLVEALILAMQSYDSSEPVNIGTGTTISIKSLIKLICKILNYKGTIIWNNSKPDGQLKRQLNVQKSKLEFDFSAKTKLEEGLVKTIEWYVNHEV